MYKAKNNMPDSSEKLNVHLKGEIADMFVRIKKYLGLEQDTEVIRALITWYYNQNKDELSGPPKTMYHINLNDKGVLSGILIYARQFSSIFASKALPAKKIRKPILANTSCLPSQNQVSKKLFANAKKKAGISQTFKPQDKLVYTFYLLYNNTEKNYKANQ